MKNLVQFYKFQPEWLGSTGALMFIVIDSNVIHGTMKIETQELAGIIKLAGALKWKIKIPDPCIQELHEGANEIFKKLFHKIESLKKEAGELFIDLEIKNQGQEGYVEDYKKRLKTYMEKKKIETIPFTSESKSLEELFLNAVEKKEPFDSTGNNFRDAVIWLSIREFQKQKDQLLIVVTNDNGLTTMIDGLKNTKIKAMKSLDATKFLSNKLEGSEKAKQEKLVKSLAVEVNKPDLIKKLKSYIERIEIDIKVDLSEELESIDGLSIAGISEPTSISENKFLVILIVKVNYTVKRNTTLLGLKENSYRKKPKFVGDTSPYYISSNFNRTGLSSFSFERESKTQEIEIETQFSYSLKKTSVETIKIESAKQSFEYWIP